MVLAGNLCHWKMSSKFVLPCLWAPVQKSTECAVFYKLLQQHRKAGGWTQREEKINKRNHLSRTTCNPPGELPYQSRDNFRISREQHSSRGVGFARKSAKQFRCRGEGKGHCTPPALPGLQLHQFTSHKPHFCCQVFIQLSAFDIVNQVCQELCNS